MTARYLSPVEYDVIAAKKSVEWLYAKKYIDSPDRLIVAGDEVTLREEFRRIILEEMSVQERCRMVEARKKAMERSRQQASD